MKITKHTLSRLAAWGIFLSLPLLIYPPFLGKAGIGGSGKGGPLPEPGPTPVVHPVPVVKSPPKAIVVEEALPVKRGPVRSAKPRKKASSNHAQPKAIVLDDESGHMKAGLPKRTLRYTPQDRGSVMWLKRWPGRHAIRGSSIQNFEPLLLISQRRSYRTGTVWCKVRKNNGRSGWIPAGYLK